jgi:hypothetical protein
VPENDLKDIDTSAPPEAVKDDRFFKIFIIILPIKRSSLNLAATLSGFIHINRPQSYITNIFQTRTLFVRMPTSPNVNNVKFFLQE